MDMCDIDGSGALDVSGVGCCVKLNFNYCSVILYNKILHHIYYDSIPILHLSINLWCLVLLQADEFLDFIRSQKEEASARIKELTEHAVMVNKANPSEPYTPPSVGTVYIHVAGMCRVSGSVSGLEGL